MNKGNVRKWRVDSDINKTKFVSLARRIKSSIRSDNEGMTSTFSVKGARQPAKQLKMLSIYQLKAWLKMGSLIKKRECDFAMGAICCWVKLKIQPLNKLSVWGVSSRPVKKSFVEESRGRGSIWLLLRKKWITLNALYFVSEHSW